MLSSKQYYYFFKYTRYFPLITKKRHYRRTMFTFYLYWHLHSYELTLTLLSYWWTTRRIPMPWTTNRIDCTNRSPGTSNTGFVANDRNCDGPWQVVWPCHILVNDNCFRGMVSGNMFLGICVFVGFIIL